MTVIEHPDDDPDAMSKLVRETLAVVEEARESGRQEAAEEIESLRQQLAGAVDLLHRWLNEASAMGGGPRAQLTQDTLDAVGMPPDHPGGQ